VGLFCVATSTLGNKHVDHSSLVLGFARKSATITPQPQALSGQEKLLSAKL